MTVSKVNQNQTATFLVWNILYLGTHLKYWRKWNHSNSLPPLSNINILFNKFHFFRWPCGSLIFNIFCYTINSLRFEKCSNIWSQNWLATWVKLKFNTTLTWIRSDWGLCSIDSGEILEPIIQFHASLLLSEIHLRLITISLEASLEKYQEKKKENWILCLVLCKFF